MELMVVWLKNTSFLPKKKQNKTKQKKTKKENIGQLQRLGPGAENIGQLQRLDPGAENIGQSFSLFGTKKERELRKKFLKWNVKMGASKCQIY